MRTARLQVAPVAADEACALERSARSSGHQPPVSGRVRVGFRLMLKRMVESIAHGLALSHRPCRLGMRAAYRLRFFAGPFLFPCIPGPAQVQSID
jgi:hypothetical protein